MGDVVKVKALDCYTRVFSLIPFEAFDIEICQLLDSFLSYYDEISTLIDVHEESLIL